MVFLSYKNLDISRNGMTCTKIAKNGRLERDNGFVDMCWIICYFELFGIMNKLFFN